MVSIDVSRSSKPQFLRNFDGSGREPREVQVAALNWVAEHWHKKFLVLNLPVGVGKSAIARAIQLHTRGGVIASTNQLLGQYIDDYPGANAVMGADNYECTQTKISCGDMLAAGECCGSECKYKQAKEAAIEGVPSFYNPISNFYSGGEHGTLILDECHRFIPTLRLLIGYRFKRSKYRWPKLLDLESVANWIAEQSKQYRALSKLYADQRDIRRAGANAAKANRLSGISKTILSSPSSYIWYETTDIDPELVIEPVDVPRSIIESIIGGAERIILMSATIPHKWASQILGSRSYEYLSMPSPIPKESRKILFDPCGLTSRSSPRDIAEWIRKQHTKHGGNTIVHVTYSLAKALVPLLPGAHIHSGETKAATLKRFKAEGGIWLAAGCAEGIDLPGDTARLNLIPVLPFADRNSPLAVAIMARDPYEYYLETAVTFMQQVGRTTRGVGDHSVTVCGDDRLSWLLNKVKKDVPDDVMGAIKWN